MFTALIAGSLVRDAEVISPPEGKPGARALVRVPTEDGDSILVELLASSPSDLDGLRAGAPIAALGRGHLRVWSSAAGVEQHGLQVALDQVITMPTQQQIPHKERKP